MRIFLKNFTFEAILGLLEEERTTPQTLIINVKINYIYSPNKFLDYSLVAKSIENLLQKRKFLLIEDALEEVVLDLKQKFPIIKQIKLQISKPDILANCIVGAKIKKNFKNF